MDFKLVSLPVLNAVTRNLQSCSKLFLIEAVFNAGFSEEIAESFKFSGEGFTMLRDSAIGRPCCANSAL